MGVTKVVTKPIGCLLKVLLPFIIIIALLAAAFFVVINLTPEKIGIADKEIYEGQTLRDMGFAEFKLKDIYTYIKGLTNPNEGEIVTNKPAEEDKTSADAKLTSSTVGKNEDGSINYSTILSAKVTYDKEYLLTYADVELASIFSQLVADANTAANSDESIKYLADLGANFEEITVKDKNAETGSATLRLVASISLASIKEQITGSLPDILKKVIKIPEKVYIVSYLTIEANADGVIVCTSQSIKINDQDSALTNAIFSVLAKNAGTDGDSDTKTNVNNKIGEGFSYFISNLGKVGTATTVDGTSPAEATAGTEVYGNGGIANGFIKVITHVTEAAPEV